MSQLEKIRKERNMSRKELADAAGVTRVSIHRYEHGQRVPDINTANRLARALGCKMEDLVADNILPETE